MDLTTTSLGYWVRRQRRALDLTQRALAACVGCATATIKKLEADQRRPSRQMAERLAVCLRIADDQRNHFLRAAQQERAPETLPLPTAAILLAPSVTALDRPLTRFVGRERELRTIEARLVREGCRLLTVVGLGGVGKTRLALEAAAALAQRYADGVCFVSLADISNADETAATVLRRLRLPLTGSVDAPTQLVRTLRSRRLLLVLDNVEHLVHDTATVELLRRILAEALQVALLVTSRERLNLQDEWVLPLDGLPLNESATALFADRARQIGQDVAIDSEHAATICRLVEGMPLAVELAAGWTQFMTLAQIVAQLQSGLPVLATHLRDVPDRHRSLEALFDQSWRLLTLPQQAVWMRLGVFRSGFDSQAAAAIADADLATLRALVNKSLVRVDGRGHYELHALARQYAEQRLVAAGAAAEARRRHANHYFALAQQAAGQEQPPDGESRWDRVEAAYPHLRAAWQSAVAARQWRSLWQVVPSLFSFWQQRGFWAEGRDMLRAAVAVGQADDSPGYALTLIALMAMLSRTGHTAEALRYGEEGYQRALTTEDPYTIGMAEVYYAMHSDDLATREAHFQAARAAGKQANNRQLLALVAFMYGDLLREQGALARAHACYTESLTHARALRDVDLTLYPLGNLGRLALLDGALDRAAAIFGECVAMARTHGAPIALVDWLLMLGIAQVHQHTPLVARATLTECVKRAEELDHWYSLPRSRAWLAAATLQSGDSTAVDDVLQLSLAGYAARLHSFESEHPSSAELAEVLVVTASILTAQERFEKAAIMIGCAETLAADPQVPVDPFLLKMADTVREQLAQTTASAALQQAFTRGRTTSALACVTAALSDGYLYVSELRYV